ncbi:hypothetical protein [Fictibacillus sp. 23RED33]|uniref:hypothetical protein n=1 Tax=Fictibacillus sp. 23RED33 TaxID=2745879 RepID=UPI001E4EB096|nr:hypothetical protein [Fictibacillus sp. 23RED33]
MKLLHLIIAIIIFSFCITGCSISTDGNGQQAANHMNYDFPPAMKGFVNVNGNKYEMKSGNYKWERKKGSETEAVTTDAASPSQIAEAFNAISVKPSANIHIEIQDHPKISVYHWYENDRDKEVILKNNRIAVPSSEGRYIYEVLAKWSNGEVSYTFVIDVK